MKVLELNQMELVNGGKCGWKAFWAVAGMIGTIGSIGAPFLVGLAAVGTAKAVHEYWECIGFYEAGFTK